MKYTFLQNRDAAAFLGDGLSDFAAVQPILTAAGALCHAVRGNNDWSSREERAVCFVVNGVRFFRERLHALKLDARALHGVKVAAIGRPTSERLASLGFPPDIVPAETTFHDMLLAIKSACE